MLRSTIAGQVRQEIRQAAAEANLPTSRDPEDETGALAVGKVDAARGGVWPYGRTNWDRSNEFRTAGRPR